MSRKALLAIIGVLGAVLAFFKDQFGLSIDPTSIVVALAAIIVYIVGEARLDVERWKAQAHRWRDPKFWIAFVSVILAAVNKEFGFNLPVEVIISILGFIMLLLFGKAYKKI